MRNQRNERRREERLEREKRHNGRMEKSQQTIDVMKSLISITSNKKQGSHKKISLLQTSRAIPVHLRKICPQKRETDLLRRKNQHHHSDEHFSSSVN